MEFYVSLLLALIIYIRAYNKYRTCVIKEFEKVIKQTGTDNVISMLALRSGVMVLIALVILIPYVNVIIANLVYESLKNCTRLESK